MEFKTEIMDAEQLSRSIKRISHEILEGNKGTQDLILIGIKRRGVPIAEKIAKNILAIEGKEVPVYSLDITFYRDDLTKLNIEPTLNKAFEAKDDLIGKTVVLVDDVIFTGRTVRAAMDAVLKCSRPELIKLAVIIDRGHRQLPIRADYVGKNVPTSKDEHISVCVKDFDDVDGVYLVKNS